VRPITIYLLLWSLAFLEKTTAVEPDKKFPAFYRPRRIITVFTRAFSTRAPSPNLRTTDLIVLDFISLTIPFSKYT
jgi:hypothetical protein